MFERNVIPFPPEKIKSAQAPEKKKQRRSKGSNSITKVQRGEHVYFRCEISRTINGERIRRSAYGKSSSEARRKASDMLARLGGELRPRSPGSVAELLEHWIEHSIKPNRRRTTYELYRGFLKGHISPLLGNVPLETFGPPAVERFYAKLRSRGASDSLLDHIARCCRAGFEQARRKGIIETNPFARVMKPRYEPRERPILGVEEAQRLLVAAKGDRLESLLIFAL